MRNEDKNNNSLITNRNILLTYNSNLNKSNPLATNNNSRIELRENGAWDGATSEDLEQLAKMLENFQPQPPDNERTFGNCRVKNENVETQPTSSTASRVLSDFRTMAAGDNTDDAEDKVGDTADHGDTNEGDDGDSCPDGENTWFLGEFEEEEAGVLRKRGRRPLPRPFSLCLSSDLGRQRLDIRIIVRSKSRLSLLLARVGMELSYSV
jgi:hypothetical protein